MTGQPFTPPHLAEVEEAEASVPLKPTPFEEVLAMGQERVALLKHTEHSSWVWDGGGNHSAGGLVLGAKGGDESG